MQLNICIFKITIRKTKKKTFLISSKYSMQSLCRSLLRNQSAKNLQSYLSLWKPLHGTRNWGYSSTSPPLNRDQNPKQPEDSDYRIVNCPGGEGRVLKLPFHHHTTDTYRFEVAEVSEVANFDHNFYWTSRLFEPISILPGDSNHPALESLLAAVLKLSLQTHVSIKRKLQERLKPLVSITAIRKV